MNREMPDWLRPYKNEWLSAGRLKLMIAAEGRIFGSWFDSVRHRIRSVQKPHTNGTRATHYLVRHVWAAALAHGVRLVPSETMKEPGELREENAEQRAEIARLRKQLEKAEKVEAMPLFRLLIAATDVRPVPGVYFLLDDAGEVVYVGQSRNVLARLAGHVSKGYADVRMIHIPDDRFRLQVERRFIGLLLPPLNVAGTKQTAAQMAGGN